MKAYLAIKFRGGRNRRLIEGVSAALESAGFEATVMVRNHEQ